MKFCLRFLLCSLMLLGAAQAWAATISVEGSLPRNLNTDRISITINIIGLTAEQTTAADETAEDFYNRIEIIMPKIDPSTEVAASEEDASSAQPIYMVHNGASLEQRDDVFDLTVDLELIDTIGDTFETEYGVDEQIVFEITYWDSADRLNELGEGSTTLTTDSFVPNQAPFLVKSDVTAGNQSLVIDLDPTTSVSARASDGSDTTKEVSEINIFVVPRLATEVTKLNARTFSPDADDDPETQCDLILANADFSNQSDEAATACVDCPNDLDYLAVNDSSLPQPSGVTVYTASISDGQYRVTGLENGAEYVVFMQYATDGVQRSSCVLGTPEETFSLMSLNDEGQPDTVDARCFIATAAYGSAFDVAVDGFRAYRDEVLMQDAIGRWLVGIYYQMSPPLAAFIDDHNWAKRATRAVFDAWLSFFPKDLKSVPAPLTLDTSSIE